MTALASSPARPSTSLPRYLLLGLPLALVTPACTHSAEELAAGSWAVSPHLDESEDGAADFDPEAESRGGELETSSGTMGSESGEPADDWIVDEGGAPSDPTFADAAECALSGQHIAFCQASISMRPECRLSWALACEAIGGQIIDAGAAQPTGSWPCDAGDPLMIACTSQFQSDCVEFFNGEFDCSESVDGTCVEGVCSWPEPG